VSSQTRPAPGGMNARTRPPRRSETPKSSRASLGRLHRGHRSAPSIEEKRTHARRLCLTLGVEFAAEVDDLEGSFHASLDRKPDAAYLVDTQAGSWFRSMWSGDGQRLRAALVVTVQCESTRTLRPLLGALVIPHRPQHRRGGSRRNAPGCGPHPGVRTVRRCAHARSQQDGDGHGGQHGCAHGRQRGDAARGTAHGTIRPVVRPRASVGRSAPGRGGHPLPESNRGRPINRRAP
jgi:hypothetical protein